MDESERLQRWKQNYNYKEHGIYSEKKDEEIANRISALLNHPGIDKYCMVDAYYYDFSVIPRPIQERLNLWRDAYLIFGIKNDGEMISKWVDRWDLDSPDPIIDGKVMHGDTPRTNIVLLDVSTKFDPNLLSTPIPDLIHNMFGKLNG